MPITVLKFLGGGGGGGGNPSTPPYATLASSRDQIMNKTASFELHKVMISYYAKTALVVRRRI